MPTKLAVGPGLTNVTPQPTLEYPNSAVGGFYDPMPGPPPPEEDYIDDFYLQPDQPIHSQNEYDTAPDFADWDDFFESPGLHDLNNILKNYSVVISYSGSRFYGTIVDPNISVDELFPRDYQVSISVTPFMYTQFTSTSPSSSLWFDRLSLLGRII